MVCSCEIQVCPTHFGCSYKQKGIWWILEFELHVCALIVAHFRKHVEYIRTIHKQLCEPPLHMTKLAWHRTKLYCLLKRRRCTCQGAFKTFRFVQQGLVSWFVLIRLGILKRFVDKHWQKCLFQPSENWGIHPSIDWPFIVPLSWNVIQILGVSQYQWEIY